MVYRSSRAPKTGHYNVFLVISVFLTGSYQTLPILNVAFLEDNYYSAFVSHILLCFDKRRSNLNRA